MTSTGRCRQLHRRRRRQINVNAAWGSRKAYSARFGPLVPVTLISNTPKWHIHRILEGLECPQSNNHVDD